MEITDNCSCEGDCLAGHKNLIHTGRRNSFPRKGSWHPCHCFCKALLQPRLCSVQTLTNLRLRGYPGRFHGAGAQYLLQELGSHQHGRAQPPEGRTGLGHRSPTEHTEGLSGAPRHRWESPREGSLPRAALGFPHACRETRPQGRLAFAAG